MARRRLITPASGNVPRAEHPAVGTQPASRFTPGAPIASVAADAAGTAAVEEMAQALENARENGRMILDLPLAEIEPDHLTRDRLPTEDAEMETLRESIRAHGQRTPIEVTALKGTLPYGLISGWRRLVALKSLHAETGEARFATVQAILRNPATVVDAYVNMIEENEIRVGLSHYERARVAALATERGIFGSEKQALLTLFETASRAKRSRIRAFLELYHALDDHLRFPAQISERLGLQLVERVREGRSASMVEVLEREAPKTPEEEIGLLTRLSQARDRKPARKKKTREEVLLPGVALEQTLRGHTLTLKLSGHGVNGELRDEIRRLLNGLSERP